MCTPPRGLRGWGCPRRAAGPSVPLSADTVSRPPPPPPWLGWGSSGAPACGEKRRGFELAPRPRAFRGRCLPPSRASSRRKRSLGGCWPLGLVVGGWGTVSRHVAGVGGPRWVVWAVWGRVAGPPSFHRPALGGRCLLASGRPRAPPALPPPTRLCGAFLPRRASAVRARFPATTALAPTRRDGRLAPEAESVCASAPRGRVPRRRPAGRRGVCPPLRALPPGCGRAAARAPEPPAARGRGLWRRWGREGDEGVRGASVARVGLRRPCAPQPPATRPPPSTSPARPRPVRPVTAGSCSRPAPPRCLPLPACPPAARCSHRPAPAAPARPPAAALRGATGGPEVVCVCVWGGGARWRTVPRACVWRGGGAKEGGPGRSAAGSLRPLLGTLLAGALNRARARPPRRDLRSDVATR